MLARGGTQKSNKECTALNSVFSLHILYTVSHLRHTDESRLMGDVGPTPTSAYWPRTAKTSYKCI